MIRNTKAESEVNPLGTLLEVIVGSGIERQEARGQIELVNDSALPVRGLDAPEFAAWGIEVIGPRADDPLFADVKLPPGWALHPTDHSMWSDLKDDAGTVRAHVFYKAAFYDRNSFISVARPRARSRSRRHHDHGERQNRDATDASGGRRTATRRTARVSPTCPDGDRASDDTQP